MDGKSQIWLNEIMNLSPEDKKHEMDMMKMEMYNLELKMMVYNMVDYIKKREDYLARTMMENIQLNREKEIG